MQQFQTPRRMRALASACVVALMLVFSVGCSRESPEQAVRLQVDALQDAIEERDAGDVHNLLAEEFIGNEGLDRRGARQLAAGMFLRHRDVAATLGGVEIELRGKQDAIARFTVLATGGSGGLLPDRGQVFEVETGWRLVDGEWRLLSATWKPRLS